jgi:hypothetical protein
MLPNFFLVGAPKAGTTSLYRYLEQHPGIYFSPIKEPCYFSEEIRRERFAPEIRHAGSIDAYLAGPMTTKRFGGPVSRWEDYVRLFANVRGETAIGEASVCYLWSPTAARNIAAAVPDAKIVIVLRDPVERAWSQYRDMVANAGFSRSFDDLIQRSLAYRGDSLTFEYPFLEFGCYDEQVARYRALFPLVQVHRYDDFRDRPRDTIASIFRFLQVDDSFVPDMSCRHRVPPPAIEPMSAGARALLEEYYAAHAIARMGCSPEPLACTP